MSGTVVQVRDDALTKTCENFLAMRQKRKTSGRNVLERERSTVQVKLRLPQDVADDLDDLAERWKITRSGAVARLLEERATPDRSNER